MLPRDAMTAECVSRLLGVDPSCVRRWVRRGLLPAVRVGGRLRISRADALAFVRPAVQRELFSPDGEPGKAGAA